MCVYGWITASQHVARPSSRSIEVRRAAGHDTTARRPTSRRVGRRRLLVGRSTSSERRHLRGGARGIAGMSSRQDTSRLRVGSPSYDARMSRYSGFGADNIARRSRSLTRCRLPTPCERREITRSARACQRVRRGARRWPDALACRTLVYGVSRVAVKDCPRFFCTQVLDSAHALPCRPSEYLDTPRCRQSPRSIVRQVC